MSSFAYRDGRLHAESVPLDRIARAVGTPVYVYSTAALENAYDGFAGALREAGLDPLICYALKANSNQAVIRTLAGRGAGADVVSEGELRRALAAGVPPEKTVFAGVGKTRAEMAVALDAGIYQFNVESLPELEALAQVAEGRGKRAPVAIRVNPDVDARTHSKITTGKSENKFGIDLDHVGRVVSRARELPAVEPLGLAVHIGSQLTELQPFRDAFSKLVGLYGEIRASGVPLSRLDLGGGLGVAYRGERAPSPQDYAQLVAEATAGLDAQLIFEPGRHLTAAAGVLLAQVIYVKHGLSRRFVVIDAAMNDIIRPSLYDAWHDVRTLREHAGDAPLSPADVVGPVCETGDTLAAQRQLPELAENDFLAIFSAGAYGAVMSSTYNSRLLVPEVMVSGDDWAVIRPRGDYEALIAADRLPGWLEDGGPESGGRAPES